MAIEFKKIVLFLIASLLMQSCSLWSDPRRYPTAIPESDLSYELLSEHLPQARKTELEIMQLNVLRFLLNASFRSDEEKLELVSNAREYFYKTSAKILSNYTAANRGEEVPYIISHPPAWTLEADVRFLERDLAIAGPEIRPEYLDLARMAFSRMDLDVLPLEALPAEIDRDEVLHFLKEMQSLDSDSDQILLLMKQFESRVSVYFERVRNIGSELATHPDIDLGDEQATKFLKLFLNHYYENVDDDVLKTILFDVITLGHEPSALEGAQIMFKNSGPGLGKGLQQLGKEPSMGKALSEILETLEDAGKVVPHYMVDAILSNDPGGYIFDEIAQKPLGTGTVAQVQKAMLSTDGALVPVAVRFFKPGIEERAADDVRILSSFVVKLKEGGLLDPAMIPQAEKLVSSLKDFLYQELDMQATVENQKIAAQVYAKTLVTKVGAKNFEVEFVVPKLYESTGSNSQSKLHVQEFLPPKTKFSKLRSRVAREAISNTLFELFFKAALFGTGFMHSDLHQGNFSILDSKPGRARVAIYDYGMIHTLSMEARRSFLLIGAGADLVEADLLALGMKSFKKNIPKAELKKLEKLIKIEISVNGPKSAEDWIVWGIQHGHLESPELGTMARGSLLIWQLPKAIGTSKQMEDFLEVMVESEVKKSVGKEGFPLTRKDRFTLISKSIKGSCFDMMRKLFR